MPANVEKMALIGQPSWHGLEDVMPADAPMSQWKKTAGLMHRVIKTPVMYVDISDGHTTRMADDKFVLYRDDTKALLSTVGPEYNVVQPGEIIDFFNDLVAKYGFKMETAGCLAGGRKVWALARTGNEVEIGKMGDLVKQYLLLATSYDKSIETTGKNTMTRVVCQNTLSAAMGSGEPAVTVNHRSVFDAQQVKIDLGLLEGELSEFAVLANRMHSQKVKKASDAMRWYVELVTGMDGESSSAPTNEQVLEMAKDSSVLRNMLQVFREGKGAEPTVWGLVNGVTAFVDHVRGRTPESGLNSAWFGAGATLKEKAWRKAVATVTKTAS